VQGRVDLSTVEGLELAAVVDPGGTGRVQVRETVLEYDSPPDGVGDGRDGVAAEGGATLGVVVVEGRPEADAALVQSILEGEVA